MSQRPWTIGASPECDVWADVPSVSGTHCRFSIIQNASDDPARFTVEDLASTNGTHVQGRRITGPTVIGPETIVTLGTNQPLPWPSEVGAIRVVRFGADASNQIVMAEPGVSSFHGRLIVGPHNTLVVEDLNSTNGICVAKTAGGQLQPSHRIKRSALVQSTDCLMLGSTPLKVSHLLATPAASGPRPVQTAASPIPAAVSQSSGAPPNPPTLQTKSSTRQRPQPVATPATARQATSSPHINPVYLFGAVAAIAAIVLLFVGVWALSPSASSVDESSLSQDQSQESDTIDKKLDRRPSGPGTSALGTSALGTSALANTKSSAIDTTSKRSGPAGNGSTDQVKTDAGTRSSASSLEADIESLADPNQASLFHIMVQSSDSLVSFRVGTAWAHDDRTLMTSALVVKAMEIQQKQGFPKTVAVHAASGDLYFVSQARKHPELESELAKSVRAIDDFESARTQKPTPNKSAKDAQTAVAERRDKLNRLGEKMLQMRTAFVAYDVARVRVEPALPTRVPKLKLAANAMLRPKQKLVLLGVPFDTEDPYYDASLPAAFEKTTWSVMAVPKVKSVADGNDLPRLILTGPASPPQSGSGIKWNRFGSPLVDSAGRVVSVFSTPSTDLGTSPNETKVMTVEGPAAVSLQALLR